MGILLAFLLFSLWTLSFPIGKYMLQFSSPMFLTGSRMLLSGLLLVGYTVFKNKVPRITKKGWLSLTILALFSIYLSNVLEFWSLSHLTAAKTCFIYGLSPFMTALLSYIHFKEKMTKMKWVGLLLGCVGFIPIFVSKTPKEELLQAFGYFTWPELAMLGAAFFSVYGWIMLRLIVKDEEIPILFANGSSMLIGGTLALLSSYFFEIWSPSPIQQGSFFQLSSALLFLTLLSNVFCYNLYGFLLKKFTATFLSLIGLLSPLFTSLHSYILLGETPSPIIFGSTFIVLIGLGIVYREEKRQGYLLSLRSDQVVN
ncbi:MAG: DMT family transporter [Chlamydiae bacterium]|nr:DMT family transporter [Chlamydiota bacterium]